MNKLILSSKLLVIATLFIGSAMSMDSIKNPWDDKLEELIKEPKDADSATKEKSHAALRADTRLQLLRLSHRFDHDDLVQAAKSAIPAQKVVTKEGSTVISLPEAVHKVALNDDGTKVAIAYGNKLKVLQKKFSWADDVYDNAFRLPLNKVAFDAHNNLVHAHNKSFYTLALKNKSLNELSRDKMAFFSTVSANGTWRFIEEIEGNKILCILVNLKTGLKFDNIDMSERISHIKAFAADAAGENFILASSSKTVYIRIDATEKTLTHFAINTELQYIADIDISADGNNFIFVGNKTLNCFKKTNNPDSFNKSIGTMPFVINAARISPLNNNHLILGSDQGIFLFDKEIGKNLSLFSPEHASIESLSISADGSTIAAGTENAAYIITCKDAERSLSAIEHLLIKRLDAEPAEKVFESPNFVNIFKNFSNPNVAQKLVKKFSIDYKKMGYEECPICMDNFANAQTICTHRLCTDCLERLKEEKQTCPICRSKM